MKGIKGAAIKKDTNILFAYSYGSFAREEKDFSDIDIAVYLKKVPKGVSSYEARLSKMLQKDAGKPVEVRVLNPMPLLFKSRLMKEGKIIFSRDKKRRIRFETELMGRCLDFSYLMKFYDKKRLERYGIR